MSQLFQSLSFRFALLVIAGLSAFSCGDQTTLNPANPKGGRMLPAYIDFNSTGTLAHLVYRSRFTYDNANRLLSINDTLLHATSAGQPANEWVRFGYTNNVLTTVDISRLSTLPGDPGPLTDRKSARFELTYSGQTLNARLLLDRQEAQKVSFSLDPAGFPLKSNVTLGELVYDGQGNIDYIAIETKRRQNNPLYQVEVLQQQYDTNKNAFADSQEVQIMAALLAATNRREASSGLASLGDVLTTNNLLYRKTRRCSSQYGCIDSDEPIIKTQVVNAAKFPTERLCSAGALGTFQYMIQYKPLD